MSDFSFICLFIACFVNVISCLVLLNVFNKKDKK